MADSLRQDEPEYFSVGHDDAQTLIGPKTISASEKDIACLFCGIGDARNLFATLAWVSLDEVRNPSSRRYHFTIVDIKPAVLARDLLMFRLLFDLSTESAMKKRETLVTLSYIFGAQVMPKWAFDRLQKGLSVTDDIDIKTPPGCEDNGPDALGYKDLTVMLPHTDLLEKHEPRLSKLFTAYARKMSSTAARQKVEEYLDSTWQPNVTLIDMDYENKREVKCSPLVDFRPHEVVRSLFGNIPAAYVGNTHGVLNHFTSFFDFIAFWMSRLQARIVIEVILGEMVDVCERLRHGILRQHQEKLGKLEPSTFPKAYDGIHMSNIPFVTPKPIQTPPLM